MAMRPVGCSVSRSSGSGRRRPNERLVVDGRDSNLCEEDGDRPVRTTPGLAIGFTPKTPLEAESWLAE